MKQNKIILLIAVIIVAGLWTSWSSCNKNAAAVAPPVPGNEFLTTLELVATNIHDPSDVDTAKWVELDPNGGAIDLSKAHMKLRANSVYHVQVFLLDETKSPATDITPEIEQRKNYHLVCFTVDTSLYGNLSSNLTITREDYDNNPTPLQVGLIDSFVTGADSSVGILETVLHHQPNVKNGDCSPGSIDIDATDTIYIKTHF